MGGARGMHVKRGATYRIFMGKPEGKRPFIVPRRRWDDNIITDLYEV
jgi:hypothetical protein